MNNLVFVCLFGLLCAKGGSILSIDGQDYSLQQFYSYYPKKQWATADSTKRGKIYSDFLKRELCILEAKRLGLDGDPSLAIKIRNRSHQLLVNQSYENLVAMPLINQEDLAEARMFAREEIFVSHILIGFSGARLSPPPKRSLDDAFLLSQDIIKQYSEGADFSYLAEKYSEDPSVSRNSGSLGWVGWGTTVPTFQSVAFRLDGGVLSDPVQTVFGYHLILVMDRRASDYQYMLEGEYESAIKNLSLRSIRDKLRDAAVRYDSLQIDEHDIYFNIDALSKISHSYNLKKKSGVLNNTININAADFLQTIGNIDVVCVYGGKGFGPLWFANKMQRIPRSRQPDLGSESTIISAFKTLILQDIALKNAYLFEIDTSFSFLQRKRSMISDLLYNAYLKSLINSVSNPDTSDVQQYYNENLLIKYTDPETVLIREVRVASRHLADSLLILLDAGVSFQFLASEYGLINPDNGGLVGPFSREKNQPFFDAAILLEPQERSPILAARGGQFSIILLEEKTPGVPLDLSRIFSQIESLLIKERQDSAKNEGIDGLFDKYNIHQHQDLLYRASP